MDIGAMFAMGLFGNAAENKAEEGRGKVTDFQFKAMILMCLRAAETTETTKKFIKFLTKDWAGMGELAPYLALISNFAEAVDDMERVKSTLERILTVSG